MLLAIEHALRAGASGYVLNLHGRYSHHEWYLRQELEAPGFRIVSWDQATLRHEVGEPVTGHVVIARRGG